ncbi:MAG: hypothetical protein ACI4VH_07125 [Clostridia bacterium]
MALILKLLEEKNNETPTKHTLDAEKTMVNIAKCQNPRCITSEEKELDQVFTLTDAKNKVYRCKYCETILKK